MHLSPLHFSWLLNFVLFAWILAHAIPQLQVETRLYPTNAQLPDGSRYYGDEMDGRFHGVGKLVWSNGDRYQGEFHQGMVHGEGLYEFASGDSLKAVFYEGYAEGLGKYQFADGNRYKGEFHKNYMHGNGRLEYANGNYYEGEFTLGNFDGEGEFRYIDGQIYSGQFEKGDLLKGSHRDAFGNVYSGAFSNGLYHGDGSLHYNTGDVYEGKFSNGLLEGWGVHTAADGSTYKGQFVNSTYHGSGTYESAGGEKYVGDFEYGLYHGQGELTFTDAQGRRSTQHGQWSFGVLQDELASTQSVRAAEGITAETVLYNQSQLLDSAGAQLVANDPDKIDLYFLGLAGDASQDVFIKELRFIEDRMQELFDVSGRSMLLANHHQTSAQYPLATQQSLERALENISAVMDPEQDILMLYMTSHGSATHEFYINDERLQLADISAGSLANTLDELPIKWRVVLISACFSGGFIPHLENQNTLIMTAARSDRQSFGCSNDSEMTYFGKALFKESMTAELTFAQAFDKAVSVIERWEDDDQVDVHSEPQIFMGKAIERHLERWRQQ